jgi:hypothetical protein
MKGLAILVAALGVIALPARRSSAERTVLDYRALMGDPTMMIFSAYGRILLVKLGAAAIVLLIGAYY